MSLSGLLEVARSGIMAQSGALTVTGQNVANATTAGYTKRVTQLTTQIDGGVTYGGSTRTFNRFTFAHYIDQSGQKSAADARAQALAGVEAIVAPPSDTIGDRGTALATSFNSLAAYPNDPVVRADVLSKADDFASAISSAASALSTTSKELFQQAQSVVGEVNDRLGKIADLNTKIADATAQGSDASALRDQRDVWVKDVADRVGARAIEDPQGRVTLFSAGAVLVQGDKASPLSIDLATSGKIRVTAQGAGTNDITSRVDSGTLGGLIEARDVDLAKTQQNLDSYAYDVSNAVNTVHAAGFGTDGVSGRALFTPPATQVGAAAAMSVDVAMRDHPELVAAAGTAAELPGGNGNANTLAQLADQDAFGGTTLANRFASLAGDLGTRKASAEAESSLRGDTLSLAENMNESASGVSIDEEMVDMTRYQRAFEASSKVLQTADDLLDGFLRQF